MLGGHEMGESRAAAGAGFVAGGESTGIPGVGGDIVEWNAFPLFMEEREIGLRDRQALPGGELEPTRRIGVAERNTEAPKIKNMRDCLRLWNAMPLSAAMRNHRMASL